MEKTTAMETTATMEIKPGDFVLPKGDEITTGEKEAVLKKKLEKTLTPSMQLELKGKCLLNPKLSIADNFIVYDNHLLIAVMEDANMIIAKIMEQLSEKDLTVLNNDLAGGLAKLRDENKILQAGQKLPMSSMTAEIQFYHDLGLVKYDGKVITLQVAA